MQTATPTIEEGGHETHLEEETADRCNAAALDRAAGHLPTIAAPAGAAPRATRGLQLRVEARAAVVAISGPGVHVRCSISSADRNPIEVFGHADWNRRLIELSPAICRALNALVAGAARPYSKASFAQAQALLVLAHESVHVSDYVGRADEALTECRAIQLVHTSALVIGVDEETGRALGHEAMRFDARLPGPGDWMVGLHEIPSYHAADCRDGAALDIHLDSSDWPN